VGRSDTIGPEPACRERQRPAWMGALASVALPTAAFVMHLGLRMGLRHPHAPRRRCRQPCPTQDLWATWTALQLNLTCCELVAGMRFTQPYLHFAFFEFFKTCFPPQDHWHLHRFRFARHTRAAPVGSLSAPLYGLLWSVTLYGLLWSVTLAPAHRRDSELPF
jgi:hypothetical protein